MLRMRCVAQSLVKEQFSGLFKYHIVLDEHLDLTASRFNFGGLLPVSALI
jgi:hypothetical protein